MLRRRGHRVTAPLRGVNLGHWLVLERWMESDRRPGPFASTAASDEYGLHNELAEPVRTELLETHRSAYVTADTFAWLARQGVNLVRIPVPFFVFGDSEHQSCIHHLDHALDWANDAGIMALVDLHTVPGSQNGFDNGGVSGLCSWHLKPTRVQRTLSVLEELAKRYATHPALFGIEAMNEPASPLIFRQSMARYGADYPERVERSAPIPHAVLAQFYRLVFERLRPILGQHVALVFHDQFQLEAWDKFLPADRYPNVWIDTHQYIGTMARSLHVKSLRGHVALARATGARIARANRHHPVLVGEWSLSNTIKGISEMDAERKNDVYRAYAQAQLKAFERGSGSCFWSLRNASRSTWSFEDSVRKGWLDLG